MINKVVFFNFYHNGDLHVSRGLVHEITKRCHAKGIRCEYYHECDVSILSDIPFLQHTKHKYDFNKITPSSVVGDTLFINTWYGANKNMFNSYGVSFDTLYRSFSSAVAPLKIDFKSIDPITMFPQINFSKFYIKHAQSWLSKRKDKKKVFISNGLVLSGQFPNFTFSPVINHLAKRNKDIDFLISNKEKGLMPLANVFLTQDIIKKSGVDLNENSFLASHCDLIVGRFSGAYTFAMTKENYFDSTKNFVVFTVPTVNTWLWTYKYTPAPKANIVHHGCVDERQIIQAIHKELPK